MLGSVMAYQPGDGKVMVEGGREGFHAASWVIRRGQVRDERKGRRDWMVAEREGITFPREAKRGETNKRKLFKARSKVRVPDGMNGLDREDKIGGDVRSDRRSWKVFVKS